MDTPYHEFPLAHDQVWEETDRVGRVRLCNLLLSIARFPERDPGILKRQGGEVSMEISTKDITKIKN